MRLKFLVGVITILLISLPLSYAAEYEIERSPWTQQQQPSSLDDAVKEIQQMINNGRSKWDIAKRVATIADNQIKNANDAEALEVSLKHIYNWPLRRYLGIQFAASDEENKFQDWSAKMGDEGPYDKTAQWVWENKYGQCAENAALVYYILKKAGADDVRIVDRGNPSHRFVVWGLGEGDPNDPNSWTERVIVPDSWQHRVLGGKQAYKNKYIGNNGTGTLKDHTHVYDTSAKPPCGYPIPGSSCCRTIPPCRGNPNFVCVDDQCRRCGDAEGQPCCEGDRCREGLVCKDGFCLAGLGVPAHTPSSPDVYLDKPFGKPQYLIHITETSTLSGPIKKDVYILWGETPKDGILRTPDASSGGWFINKAEEAGGPFQTPREVCANTRGIPPDKLILDFSCPKE